MITSTQILTPNQEKINWKRLSKHINANSGLLDNNQDKSPRHCQEH